MTVAILNIYPAECELGEGIYYSARHNSLFWVDIKQCLLYRQCFDSRDIRCVTMPEQIGWVKETRSGKFIAGLQSGIYWLRDDLSCGEQLLALPDEPASNRLNDAKTDRQGRLYFGSMDDTETTPSGKLYALENVHNAASLNVVDCGYVVSNGPAISPSGDTLYSVSSASRTIYAFSLTAAGELSNKRVFTVFPAAFGYPDGVTVDREGNLWVACWQGHSVCCFDVQGRLIQRIILPVPLVTNVIFAGPDYSRLFITSARVGLHDSVLKRYPLSGCVFELATTTSGCAEALVNDT